MRNRPGHASRIMDRLHSRTRFLYKGFQSKAARSLLPLLVIGALAVPIRIAAAQSAGDSSIAGTSSAGDPQNGKKLFVRYACYQCHGREAQGGGLNGPRLAPDPIPLEALLIFVRHPGGEMPPYTKKVVSDKDLTDIHAFLASQPQPPPVNSIPILKH